MSAFPNIAMASEDDPDFTDNAIRSSVDAMERMLREALVFGGPVQDDEGWLLRSRRMVARAVTSFTAYAILSLLVITNTVALALFDPLSPGSPGNTTILYVCAAVNAIFSLDAVLKIFAFGLTGKGGYISDGWNLADVALIVIGWAAFGASWDRRSQSRHFSYPLPPHRSPRDHQPLGLALPAHPRLAVRGSSRRAPRPHRVLQEPARAGRRVCAVDAHVLGVCPRRWVGRGVAQGGAGEGSRRGPPHTPQPLLPCCPVA